MDRQQFELFCKNLYMTAYEEGRKSVPGIDITEVQKAISETPGIGSKDCSQSWIVLIVSSERRVKMIDGIKLAQNEMENLKSTMVLTMLLYTVNQQKSRKEQ